METADERECVCVRERGGKYKEKSGKCAKNESALLALAESVEKQGRGCIHTISSSSIACVMKYARECAQVTIGNINQNEACSALVQCIV